MMHIKFTDGSNPYVLTNESHLYKWFYNYDVRIIKIADGAIFFVAATEAARKKIYKEAKEAARAFAIETQRVLHENAFSYGEIADISDTLHSLGKHLGLVREFKDNGIC